MIGCYCKVRDPRDWAGRGCGIAGHTGGGPVVVHARISQEVCGMRGGTVSSNYGNDTPV